MLVAVVRQQRVVEVEQREDVGGHRRPADTQSGLESAGDRRRHCKRRSCARLDARAGRAARGPTCRCASDRPSSAGSTTSAPRASRDSPTSSPSTATASRSFPRCATLPSRSDAHGDGRGDAGRRRRADAVARRTLRGGARRSARAPWFLLERAAARYFGVHTCAAHVNGLVRGATATTMWFARRSADKAIDPGHARQPGRRRHRGGRVASPTRWSRKRGRKPASRASSPRGALPPAPCTSGATQPDGLQSRDDLRPRPVAAGGFRARQPGRRGGRASAGRRSPRPRGSSR